VIKYYQASWMTFLHKQLNVYVAVQDSNQLHAVCLDSYPPISYMTDTSHAIVRLVHAYNNFCGENKVTQLD